MYIPFFYYYSEDFFWILSDFLSDQISFQFVLNEEFIETNLF